MTDQKTNVDRKRLSTLEQRVYALFSESQRVYKATLSKHGQPSREEERAYALRLNLQLAFEHLERAAVLAQEIDAAERGEEWTK